MLPLLFHMNNLPRDTTTIINNVHFIFCWPLPLKYNNQELIGASRN